MHNGPAPNGPGTLWEQEVRTAQAGQFLLTELLKTNQDVTRNQCLGGNHGHCYHLRPLGSCSSGEQYFYKQI